MRSTYLIGRRPVAFICGCGHTGTTLLATMLSAHPQIYVPYKETSAFNASRWHMAKALFALRWGAFRAGKRYIVEKTPTHIRRLDRIRHELPGAKFIITVRDGRDATASIARRYGADFERGLERWLKDTGISLKERDSPDVFLIRYETLISDPPGSLRRLCSFLGVEYDAAMLDYHRETRLWFKRKHVLKTSGVGPEHEHFRNWQVNQPLFDGRGRWRNELPPEMVARFASGRPKEIMKAFGYDTD